MKLILCGEPGGMARGEVVACLEAAAAGVWEETGVAVEVGRVGSAGGPGREERPRSGDGGAEPGAADVLRAAEWEDDGFDFWAFDRRIDGLDAAGGPLVLAGPWEGLPGLARQVATRAQRLARRRNGASQGEPFDRILARHRALHDLTLPLVRADYDHALDVWRWLLRLDPEAGLAVQLAALFHDVERLESEPEARREPHGPAYQEAKDAHAERGARIAAELLAEEGVEAGIREEAAALITVHEAGGAGAAVRPAPGSPFCAEAALLADADALSLFSLNSPGYLAYHGPEATRCKVAWTRARMRPAARERLVGLRLPAAVRRFLAELDEEDVRNGEDRPAPRRTPADLPPYLETTRRPTARPGSPSAVPRGLAR